MTEKTKIIIAGIGGVGGYFGGLLAKKYYGSAEVEIVFLARNEHLKEIQNKGLRVIKGKDEFIARPFLATDNATEIGAAHYIILCTKSYDLEITIEQLKPCIKEHTVLLPLLNGVDSAERIKQLLPKQTIFEGCVYIVSRLKMNGVIENSGNVESLFFGLDNTKNSKLTMLDKIFKDANIEATLSNKILTTVWEKFIFISPTATATAFYDTCIGELLEVHEETIIKLIDEVKNIAIAKGISIENTIVERTIHKLKSLPFETTSSMHSDFKSEKLQTEIASLTAYVLKQGELLKIKTPTYNLIYQQLKQKLISKQHG